MVIPPGTFDLQTSASLSKPQLLELASDLGWQHLARGAEGDFEEAEPGPQARRWEEREEQLHLP